MRGITFDGQNNPAIIDAILNAYSNNKRTGIFKDYADECDINSGISYDSTTATVTFKKGALMICGRVCYIRAGETLVLPLTATTTGSIWVKVDLSKSIASSEVQFELGTSTTTPTNKDDLLNNETDGVYYFIIYKYTSNGSTIELTKNTAEYVEPIEEVLSGLEDGTVQPKISQSLKFVSVAPTSAPDENTLIVYIGSSLPATRYARVIYIVI